MERIAQFGKMEILIQTIVFTLFGAGVACWLGCLVLWASASFCLIPEAQGRYMWNALNGVVDPKNLTVRGQRMRRWSIRCLIWFLIFPASAMIAGSVLMLIFGISLEPTGP